MRSRHALGVTFLLSSILLLRAGTAFAREADPSSAAGAPSVVASPGTPAAAESPPLPTDNAASPPAAGEAPSPPAADNVAAGEGAAAPGAPAAAESPPLPTDNAASPPAAGEAPSLPAADNVAAGEGAAAGAGDNAAVSAEPPAGGELEEPPPATIADPLEPVNRAFFVFNDKAYFWVFKPVAQGYKAVVPEGARVSVSNFFSNITTPIRLVNNLLQGKLARGGVELLRFGINSTIGMAGLFDPAKTGFHLEKRDADLGQTLGKYGLGQGFYIVWPVLGPSSARDTVGYVGDRFADPTSYVGNVWLSAGLWSVRTENEVSLSIGDYEDLKRSSLDPYAAVRDAYAQNRAKKVRR